MPDRLPSPPQEDYGRLEHDPSHRPKQLMLELNAKHHPPTGKSPVMPPSRDSPPAEEYGKLEHANKAKSPSSPPRLRTPKIKPSRPGYEDIDLDFPVQEGYGKLERKEGGSPPRLLPPPPPPPKESHIEGAPPLPLPRVDGGAPHRESRIEGGPPQLPPPRESRDTSKSPVQGRKMVPKKPLPYSGSSTAKPDSRRSTSPVLSPPGQLGHHHIPNGHTHPSHTHPNHTQHVEDQYETLDDASQMQIHPEEYGKLSHTQFTSPSEENYEKLESKSNWESSSGSKKLSVPSSMVEPAGMEALARPRQPHHRLSQTTSENYGKLDRGTNCSLRSKPEQVSPNSSEQENYEKLDRGRTKKVSPDGVLRPKHEQAKPRPVPRQSSQQSPSDEYGHLERKAPASSRFGFDPYGSLPSDPERVSISSNTSQDSLTRTGPGYIIEEESSTPLYSSINVKGDSRSSAKMPVYSSLKKVPAKKKSETPNGMKGVPPPGYENATPLGNTAAAQAALQTTNGVPPVVPPRAAERNKLRYQNIGADGKILLHKQPISDEDLVDNEIYGGHSAPVTKENDNVEDVTAADEVVTSPVVSNKPLPAPKPKTKPKPHKRSY